MQRHGTIEPRCGEILLDEIGEAFNGIGPWRPVFREKMDNTLARLEAIREQLRLLHMELELREPLPEELDEVRGWFSEVPARS